MKEPGTKIGYWSVIAISIGGMVGGRYFCCAGVAFGIEGAYRPWRKGHRSV